MTRLGALALLLLLIGCAREESPPPGDPGPFKGGNVAKGGGGGGGGGADAGGLDAGTPDAGALLSCNPQVSPTTCPASTYCACTNPAGQGSDCFCFQGELGDPCPAGAAVCRTPGTCRWSSGFFWGKCGAVPLGACGDVCQLGAFGCEAGCFCLACEWGSCCQ